MFHLHQGMSYYLYSRPTDMRKSFYTLSGIITNHMGRNVQNGEVFIFINRPRDCMKILHLECGGLVLYHLRLEAGRFSLPTLNPEQPACPFSWSALMLMIQQNEAVMRKKRRQKIR